MASAQWSSEAGKKSPVVGFIDGTFGLSTSGLQIVVLGCLTNQGYATVFGYMITDSRENRAYAHLLQCAKDAGFDPQYMMRDFEQAEVNK